MYPTAVQFGFYKIEINANNLSIRIGRDPLELFIPDLSLQIGTRILSDSFTKINNYYENDISLVDDLETFNEYISNAYAGYNAGTDTVHAYFEREKAKKYKLKVLNRNRKYIPLLSINVFNN